MKWYKKFKFNIEQKKLQNKEQTNLNFNIHKNDTTLSNSIRENRKLFKKHFNDSSDVVIYELESKTGIKGLIIYIEGIVDKNIINRDVVNSFIENFSGNNIMHTISASPIEQTKDLNKAIDNIVDGNTLLVLDNTDLGYIINTKGFKNRAIEKPDVEAVIRGPREAFVEEFTTNMSMLRKIIRNSNLVFENLKIGTQTNTNVSIAYIKDIVNTEVLEEVRTRLNQIDTDAILDSGYVEQYIEDAPFSLFSTVGVTQKPDVVAGKILEGRVAIFCNGTPHVLYAPYLLIETMQTAEDYYRRPYLSSLLRFFRMLGVLISVFLPAIYVALQTYHQEMIPTVLLVSMAGTREGVPLPALAEAIAMLLMFEILRESGTRLPRSIGSAISIVGALVIGEAAVNAGLVSAPMVIVTASTAVASFTVPELTEVMTIFRFLLLILSGIMGLYGITCGLLIIVTHTVSLRSFGVPFTSPLSPTEVNGLKDYMVRFPLFLMKNRPTSITKRNNKRQGNTRRNV